MQIKIYYNDKDIVVCEKIPGTSSESGAENSFPDMLEQQLAHAEECVKIYTVHRLDNAVGGVMVFAKNSKASSELSKQIENGTFVKEYAALVHGVPQEKKGTFCDLLFKDSKKGKVYCVKSLRKGVRKAELSYELEETAETERGIFSLVRIKLKTGRTHQIRVQFASRKMPVAGDGKYGSKINLKNIMLRSVSIEFLHPATGEKSVFRDFGKFEKINDVLPCNRE